ncbi:ABC transporter B family member 7 [Plasmodium brasilianum]|uniref:ABC transporter B family member 7 n=1 Tax=Plasmodium brasilianum TaxID=5824 RepID=A0ACB9Y569_PLABR|nr:ABC transporter B family member 7 [Plasmodium brasilianum]
MVNYCLTVDRRVFLLRDIRNLNRYKSRSIIYVTKYNANYTNITKERNLFFINKSMSYINNFNICKNERPNSPQIFGSIKNGGNSNRSLFTGPSKWKIKLFSMNSGNGRGNSERGSSKNGSSSSGSFSSSSSESESNCSDGGNNSKSGFFNLKKSFKESFERKFSSHLEGISIKDIYRILKKERNYLALSMACLLISSLGQMLFPMCISKIINMYGGKEESLKYVMSEVYKTAFLILGISTFSFCRIYFIETSIEKITRRLRKSLFEKILNQNLSFFDKQKTGELITRLSNDIEVSSKILIHLSFGIRNFIAALIGGICALHISPSKLFNSFLLPVSTALLIGTSYGKYVKRISIYKQEKLSECIDFASEKIHNISNVRLLNGESFEKREFTKYLDEVYKAGTKYSFIKAGNHFLFFSIISLFLLHLINYGNYLIANKFINTGDLFSLIMYSLFCGSGIQGVMQSIGDLQKCIGSCSKVLQIINLPKNELNEYWLNDSIKFLRSDDYAIKFDNVSFSYDNNNNVNTVGSSTNQISNSSGSNIGISNSGSCNSDSSNSDGGLASRGENGAKKNYALKNVSFYLPHNKSVAIVGKSGSGKTTILNLLSKKNSVNSGNILIGNFPINNINSSALRSILGIITQNPFLFNISVRSNLLYPYKAHVSMLKEQIKLIEEVNNKDTYTNKKNYFSVEKNDNSKEIINDRRREIYNFLSEQMRNTQKNINNITEDQLKSMYKDFNIHDFLINYSKYDNINVGVNGSFLSGGQKQRVYLAQNLFKNNKILIFDEPTSSLDSLSEKIINEALLKHMKGKTTIIFTHRLDLLNFVDYIGVLNDGTMIQFGLRNNVLEKPCDILRQILNQNTY